MIKITRFRQIKLATLIGLLIGFASVGLQFDLTVSSRLARGDSLIGAILYFFTFFTILTNTSLIFTYASELTKTKWLASFRRHETRNMLACFILVVMVIYHFMLRKTWNPEGLAFYVDVGLHYLAPVYYLTWWVFLERHTQTEYKTIRLFIAPMLIYMVWVFGRGLYLNEYPYPFLDLTKLEKLQVVVTVLFLTGFFTVAIAIATEIDRRIYRRQQSRRK